MSDSVTQWEEYKATQGYKDAYNALTHRLKEERKEDQESEERKGMPVFSGVVKYFPDAIREVSKASMVGNEKHCKGQPLHWNKEVSKDDYDALLRHLMDHQENPVDTDGLLHLAKVAWRALAGLQRYLEDEGQH